LEIFRIVLVIYLFEIAFSKYFKDKDWVRAILIDLDVERGRVSLSTRVLESDAGDMLKEPWKVYGGAEEMAVTYREDVFSK
jgi:ribosomal protein S1